MFLADGEGRPLGGAASQRRLLALLLPLAVAGDRGVSRDRLMALLWPEVDESRARHSLAQALYAVRRAVNSEDVLVLSASDVRLNPEVISADVPAFESALRADDPGRAAALYRGPFADGFSLSGSIEFEHWASGQRHRLEALAAGAVERLALEAEGDGRVRDAVAWRRQLVTIRPLDTAAAMGYMRALASGGDRAGALQHGRVHETLLRGQLGLEPDATFDRLVRMLRETPTGAVEAAAGTDGTATVGAVAPVALEEFPAAAAPEDAADGILPTEPAPHAHIGARPSHPPRSRLRPARLLGVVGVGVLAIVIWLVARGRPSAPPEPAPSPLEQKVVVTPFRVSGASASLAYLREGLVELLSVRLADDSSARSVDAGAVLAAWRAAGLADLADVPRDSILAVARRLGAERVVSGSVVGNPQRVVVTATVLDVGTGQATGSATIEVPPDSIRRLVDALAVRLLLLESGEDAALAPRTTGSLRALRAFLRAQAAFRRGDYPLAIAGYEDALRADSAFALAALQLGRAADRLGSLEERAGALALAWRERASLDARGRALLLAQVGPRFPDPSDGDELQRTWEQLVDQTPDRADAWYEVGTRLYEDGRQAGDADWRADAVAALRRALRIDSTHAPARELLAYAEPTDPRTAATRTDSSVPLAPFLGWLAAKDRGDTLAFTRAARQLAPGELRNARAIAREALRRGDVRDATRAVELLQSRARRPSERMDAMLARHALATNAGRLQDAAAATTAVAELRPSAHAHLRLRVLDAVFGSGDARVASEAAGTLLRTAGARRSADRNERAVQLANACAAGFWLLAQGDTLRLRPIVDQLRTDTLAAGAVPPVVAMAPGACAAVLGAGLAVVSGSPDASSRLVQLDELAFTSGAAGDGVTFVPLVLARLHATMGDTATALEAIRRRQSLLGWPRYLAATLREEGRLALALGRNAEAVPVLERYLAMRQDADPALAAERAEVATALQTARRAAGVPPAH